MKDFKVAICQIKPTDDKKTNIKKARNMILEAAGKSASVIVFGEMFNCPYQNEYFPRFAETIPGGETYNMLKDCARDNKVYLIGGSIPELDNGIIYNTSLAFNPDGELIGKHRKMHLFDVELASGLTFKESDAIGRGDNVTVFDTEYCRMGLAICYDIRFPELMRLMAIEGAEIIIIPAAFNMTTGPAHWDILFRVRALDNQVFMVGASPARDTNSGYVAYGNSIVVAPWGDIIESAGEEEGIIYADLDSSLINRVRKELPLLKHRRTDVYELKKVK